jgi:hypothetical protein
MVRDVLADENRARKVLAVRDNVGPRAVDETKSSGSIRLITESPNPVGDEEELRHGPLRLSNPIAPETHLGQNEPQAVRPE